jgi:peptidoglycan/LPS O-acetylase OafA/YrhL
MDAPTQYRADIDGLRAIAVVLVMGFHAFPGRVPGGFVGVDVFFVISGYLITGLILRDLQQGHFSIQGFYARRIRRIFPALASRVWGSAGARSRRPSSPSWG